jgi:Leucine-rich repeat (LRR) protein
MRDLGLCFSGGHSSVELVLPSRLEFLSVEVGEFRRLDCSPLAELERLTFLGLLGVDHEGDVGFLRSLSALSYLEIEEIGKIRDLAPIANLAGLRDLSLHNCLGFDDPGFFGNFPLLKRLFLEEAGIKGGLSALVDNCPSLEDLRITGGEWSRDLDSLDGLTLTTLTLDQTGVTDLAAVARQPHLEDLTINESEVSDLSALEQLPELRRVNLRGTSSVVDVAPLRGKPDLFIAVDADQEVRNAHLLHRSARLHKF